MTEQRAEDRGPSPPAPPSPQVGIPEVNTSVLALS